MCVCVCERERERERGGRQQSQDSDRNSVCVCVYCEGVDASVCAGARATERESVCVCMRACVCVCVRLRVLWLSLSFDLLIACIPFFWTFFFPTRRARLSCTEQHSPLRQQIHDLNAIFVQRPASTTTTAMTTTTATTHPRAPCDQSEPNLASNKGPLVPVKATKVVDVRDDFMSYNG